MDDWSPKGWKQRLAWCCYTVGYNIERLGFKLGNLCDRLGWRIEGDPDEADPRDFAWRRWPDDFKDDAPTERH